MCHDDHGHDDDEDDEDDDAHDDVDHDVDGDVDTYVDAYDGDEGDNSDEDDDESSKYMRRDGASSTSSPHSFNTARFSSYHNTAYGSLDCSFSSSSFFIIGWYCLNLSAAARSAFVGRDGLTQLLLYG